MIGCILETCCTEKRTPIRIFLIEGGRQTDFIALTIHQFSIIGVVLCYVCHLHGMIFVPDLFMYLSGCSYLAPDDFLICFLVRIYGVTSLTYMPSITTSADQMGYVSVVKKVRGSSLLFAGHFHVQPQCAVPRPVPTESLIKSYVVPRHSKF